MTARTGPASSIEKEKERGLTATTSSLVEEQKEGSIRYELGTLVSP